MIEWEKRITPSNIADVPEGYVFGFGSNQGGKHGKGAAKQALGWGAKYGQAEGLQGRTYGIPTKDKSIRRTLSIKEIKPYVDRYIEFCKNNPQLIFWTTEIGCGLAGYKPKHIAPLFEEAINVPNIFLPERFWHKLIKLEKEEETQKPEEPENEKTNS
jgi:hypothetical protein